jgi:hypothetical protein
VACIALGLGVPAAHAATVRYDAPPGGVDVPPDPPDPNDPNPPPPPPAPRLTLVYGADDGANRLGVSVAAGGAVFEDPVATLGPPIEGCGTALPLTCTLTNVETLDIDLGAQDDTIALGGAGLPPAIVNGGLGDDRADYSTREGARIALDGSDAAVKFSSVENATGSPGVDAIIGNDVTNRLVGVAGADDISGGGGSDQLLGGAGDDTLDGGAGDDTLVGGADTDKFTGGSGADSILAADGVSERIDCGDGVDSVAADFGANSDLINLFDCENVTGLVDPGAAGAARQQPVTSDTAVPAPVPVLAAGVAAPGDRTPPSARLGVLIRQRLVNVLARGLLVPVRCSESCGISVAVLLDRPTARKLDLAGRAGPAVVGTATGRLAKAGSKRLRVRLTQRARKALRRAKRSVRVTVQSLVSDAAGNGTLKQRRVTLRR